MQSHRTYTDMPQPEQKIPASDRRPQVPLKRKHRPGSSEAFDYDISRGADPGDWNRHPFSCPIRGLLLSDDEDVIIMYRDLEKTEEPNQRLVHNEVDLCFIEGMIPDNDLVMKAFAKDIIIPVVPASEAWDDVNEITLEELAKLPFCTRQKGSISRRYAEEVFLQRGLVPNIVAESESTQSIVRLVSHGIGFSLLPEIMVQREIQDGLIRTIPLRGTRLERTNYIVWHKDKFLTRIMKEIISWKNESYPSGNSSVQA